MKVYFIQFTLTKNCNQKCYYCDVFKENKRVEVDLDFISYALNSLPNNTMVELSGGEPGLVKNLDEVYKLCRDHKNVKLIQLMSNGLVRKLGYDWIYDIYYNEHLVYDIVNQKVLKFYDLEMIEKPNMHYVIVTTQKTTQSLIGQWGVHNLPMEKCWFKLMNPKTHNFSKYYEDLIELFTKLNDQNSLLMLEYFMGNVSLDYNRSLCSKVTPQPAIDVEEKEIVYCATTLMKSARAPFNEENIKLHSQGKLFSKCKYCDECYTFDMNQNKLTDVLNTIKGFPTNRRIDA